MIGKAMIGFLIFMILFTISVIVTEFTLVLIDRPEWSFPNYHLGFWIYILGGSSSFALLFTIAGVDKK